MRPCKNKLPKPPSSVITSTKTLKRLLYVLANKFVKAVAVCQLAAGAYISLFQSVAGKALATSEERAEDIGPISGIPVIIPPWQWSIARSHFECHEGKQASEAPFCFPPLC